MQRSRTIVLLTAFLVFTFVSGVLFSVPPPVNAQKVRDIHGKRDDQAQPPSGAQEKEPEKLTKEAQTALYTAQEAIKVEDYAGGRQILMDFLAALRLKNSANPDQPEMIPTVLYLMLGHTYYAEENLVEAQKVFKTGYEADPSDENMLLNYAITTYETEMFTEAAPLFERLYEVKEKKDAKFLHQAAICWYQVENFDEAKRILKRLIALPGDPKAEWYQMIINICMELEQMDEAEGYIRQFLAMVPLNADYWRLLAQMRLNKEDYKGGAGALEISYFIKTPKKAKNWEDLADLFAYLNAPLRSAQNLEKAYKSEGAPTKVEKRLQLVEAYARALRVEKAVDHLDKIIAEKPTTKLYLEKGKLLYDALRVKAAIVALDQAIKLDRKNGEALVLKGFAAWDLKDWKTSRKAFTAASQIKKHRLQAEDAIAVLDDLESVKHPKSRYR
ncbi:MAG: tetratricopeptide repeat protein [Desulfobacterales bacterium]